MSLINRKGMKKSLFYTFLLFIADLLTFMILYLIFLLAELFEAIAPEMKALRDSGFLCRELSMVLFFIVVEKNFSR